MLKLTTDKHEASRGLSAFCYYATLCIVRTMLLSVCPPVTLRYSVELETAKHILNSGNHTL